MAEIFGIGDQQGKREWVVELGAIYFTTITDNELYDHYFFPSNDTQRALIEAR